MTSKLAVSLLIFSYLGMRCSGIDGAPYLGKFLGKLTELHHGVSGEVYAVDARTLHIKDFTYDGQGPAAYFFAGSSRAPGNTGFRIRDENGSPDVLRRYRKESVTITLPEGKSLNNIKWFSVWCEEFEVNFGDVKIPKNFDYPRPQKIDGLRGVHAVASDNIVIVDAQTLLIPSLSYDGEAPDAKFWVGRGPKPSPQGIRVPDENGKEIPLRRYDRKTVVLTLPGDLTVFDIGHFGIWCEAFTVDFGHVQIPAGLNVPPSLKMLGVSPQSKLNCEVLHDDLAFEVRWAVAGDSIVLQLVAKLDHREYMSFGISGDDGRSAMVGGDVVVAWVDKETLKGYAEDYYLEAKAQCSGPRGSCPDAKLADNTNNIRLLNAAMVNGYSIVTYQRPLRPSDIYDKAIFTNRSQPVIWAIGPLNQRDEVSFHSQFNKKDKIIDFGRPAMWNCPMPEGDQPSMKPVTARPVQAAYVAPTKEEEEEEYVPPPTQPPSRTRGRTPERRGGNAGRGQPAQQQVDSDRSQTQTSARQRGSPNRGSSRTTTRPPATPAPVSNRNAWVIPPIQCNEPDDGVFYAQMGPTGGKRGYPAITGHVGWGISWYINGLLIPEINVVRGKTYTFVVEGGIDPDVPAKYHPFYITDDPIGGYEHKTPEERQNVRIFAGARQAKDGSVLPTGVGRLCHWTHQGDSDADDFDSFGAYQRTLELKCDVGDPGVIQWTPDKNTPDTVYYQCFTHRYLGWRINVLDSCDVAGAASEIQEIIVPANSATDLEEPKDLAESPSIRVETRVKPNDLEDVLNKDEQIIYEKETTDIEEIPVENIKESEISTPTAESKTIQELPSLEQKFIFRKDVQQNTTYLAQTRSPPLLMALPKKIPYGMPMIIPTSKIVFRRPPQSYQTVMASMPRPQYVKYRRPTMFVKKPHYRPYVKSHMTRPWMGPPMKYEKPMYLPFVSAPGPMTNRPPMPHNVIIMKPQSKPIVPTRLAEPQVEISKLQPSTERSENIVFNEKPFRLPTAQAAPSELHYKSIIPLKEAVNTGFDPSSVVIESGFKPILTKEIESRIGEAEGPEIEIESEAGVIDETQTNTETLKEPTAQATEYFEPMFIPSPTIDMKKALMKKLHAYNKMMSAVRRSVHLDHEPIMSANERIDSHYLPPANQRSRPVARPRHRSNIDMAPGTVITFDGRKVSGASLTARNGNQDRPVFTSRSSKGTELLRRPQSVPFKGDLPPLDLKVDLNAPQLQARTLQRNLELPVGAKQSTLRELQQANDELLEPLLVIDDDQRNSRKKRAAHHNEEHTAQQEKERQEQKTTRSAATNVQITFGAMVACLVFQHLL